MNKKVPIMVVLVILILIIAVGSVLYYQHTEYKKEVEKAVKRYEQRLKVAERINNMIDEGLTPAQELIDSNPDIGEDETKIEELKTKIAELEAMKFEIQSKSKKLEELNNATSKIKRQLGNEKVYIANVDVRIAEINLLKLEIDTVALIESKKKQENNAVNSKKGESDKSYIGKWYTSDNPPNDLTISEIDNETIEFEMGIFRIALITGTGRIKDNKIDFVSNDGRNIIGTMELKQNSILVTINKSDFEYITDGETFNFTIKE